MTDEPDIFPLFDENGDLLDPGPDDTRPPAPGTPEDQRRLLGHRFVDWPVGHFDRRFGTLGSGGPVDLDTAIPVHTFEG